MILHGSDESVHGPAGPSAIDRSVLGEWLEGDDAAINGLLAVFRESIHTEHGLLRALLERNDMAECARTAHRLRGAAMTMGAKRLGDAAAALDAAAQTGNRDACATGMAELEEELRRMDAEVPSS